MKLLRVIHTVAPESGGPIEGLKQTSRLMSDLGVAIEIASLDSGDFSGVDGRQLPWKLHAFGPGRLGNFGYSAKLRDWLDSHVSDYDAVIIHGDWQYHGLAAANACIRNEVPYFIYPHGMLDPWFNATYPLKRLKKQLYWRFEHKVLSHAEAVLFTCEEERRLARKSFSPYRVNEKVVGYGTTPPVENWADLLSQFRKSPPSWGKQPFLLFMSRIQEKKGLDLLVAAYANLRSSGQDLPDLVVAGPEQQPEYVERIKKSSDQDGVHWVGSLSGGLKWQALAASEALVLPSHQENFGIVVAEALAVGTPVLISNKVNIWSEISSGAAGLVEEDTLEGTQKLLQRWSSMAQDERELMSKNALNTFHTHFDIRGSTKRLVQYIEESIRSNECDR